LSAGGVGCESREEAQGPSRDAVPGPRSWTTGPTEEPITSDRSAQPAEAPPACDPGAQLSELVDGHTGRVRASGRLTPQGADLLRGTVENLRRLGHSTVVLDLTGVQAADDAGLHVLSALETAMAAAGDRLLVRNAPVAVAPRV